MSTYHSIIKYPLITEKNTHLRTEQNKYVFHTEKKATKLDIKNAVEAIFKVKVSAVNTMTVKGKKKRMGKNVGYRSDWKKAIVTLSGGQKIDKFGEV